jgi:protocatechuate 3,4-dioxygenase beta subunit
MAKLPGYRRQRAAQEARYDHPDYRSTALRAPKQPFIRLPHTLSEITGPSYAGQPVAAHEADLTRGAGAGEAIGQRIVVSGRVTDVDGRPVPNALIEIWQCNAAGRYRHENDTHDAPLDPNFNGAGRCVTDAEGRYRYVTIEPGAYPWRNHPNAWRPKHIHLSLFGTGVATRLVTQMYFPGDPLLPYDPVLGAIPDEKARERLICRFDLETTVPETMLGYRFDIVLRGRDATPVEQQEAAD